MAGADKVPMGDRTVEVVRGQHHKFMLIPPIAAHCEWFDAGPVQIAVEARALGYSADKMVRGPSIHIYDAARNKEFIRFDFFGGVPHYHYILNEAQHNVVWGYDEVVNGPMLDWAVAVLRARLPDMLRRAGAAELADEVTREGWNMAVLDAVRAAAAAALEPRADDVTRAREGMEWMARWKEMHPQFNTVDY